MIVRQPSTTMKGSQPNGLPKAGRRSSAEQWSAYGCIGSQLERPGRALSRHALRLNECLLSACAHPKAALPLPTNFGHSGAQRLVTSVGAHGLLENARQASAFGLVDRALNGRWARSGRGSMSALCWKAACGLEAARMDGHSTNLLRSIGHPFLFIPGETRSPGNQRPGFDGLRGNTQNLRVGHERYGYAALARARSGIAELLTS